jgi:Undecaprenyl-phosphate galactose phosphotransferase WbaP
MYTMSSQPTRPYLAVADSELRRTGRTGQPAATPPHPLAATDLGRHRRTYLPYILQILATGLPLLAADVLAVTAAMALAGWLVAWWFPGLTQTRLDNQLLTLVAAVLIVFPFFGLFPGAGLNPVFELRQSILATILSFAVLLLANTAFGRLTPDELWLLPLAFLLLLILVPVGRITARAVLARRSWWGKPVLIIGAGPMGCSLYEKLRGCPALGFRPVGLIDEPQAAWRTPQPCHTAYAGAPAEVAQIAQKHRVFWAIVALADHSVEAASRVMAQCNSLPNVIVVPDIGDLPSLWSRAHDYGGVIGIHIQERLLLPGPRLVKRIMDLVLVAGGGILLLPLMALIAAAIKLVSPGPILYAHERIGLSGRPFRAWKFRTMVTGADAILERHLTDHPELRTEWERDHKLKHDPRIIKGIGKWLRKLSLDELPQLWNVMRGEMSLVGPRPIVSAEIEKYREVYPLYLKVRPGLTGLWQVSGRNLTTYDQRVDLDAYYVRNWSVWLDLFILGRTIKTVLLSEGAY